MKTRRVLPKEEEPAAAPVRARAVAVQPVKALAAPPAKPKTPAILQDRGAEKRVRRGRLEIGGTLDLHGHNQDTGRAALARFLLAAHARGARTVIVITGLGRGGEGVLKRRLPEWLAERDIRALISGFAQAHRTHGGAGAYYVFLKRQDAT